MSATESNENDVIALTFDKTKQLATIGHALTDEKFFNQLNRAVKPNYFSDPLVSKIWDACVKFVKDHRRNPTPTEIIHWTGWKDMDSLNKGKLESTVNESLAKSKQYGLDLLRNEFDVWIRGALFVETSMQAIEIYKESMQLVGPAKEKKVQEAWKRLDTGILSANGSSFNQGVEVGFRPSIERIVEERAERMADKDRILTYGVQFLDDILVGMLPTELIVLGAKTGGGKTQMATSISLHNSLQGKRIHYFALEAENNEIERRIKYSILSAAYQKEAGHNLTYKNWRMCKDEGFAHILDKLEDRLQDEFKNAVRGINTLYRTSGDFTVDNLQRYLLQISDDTDLIVVDHLHYVDVDDGRNENEVYGECIKTIRDVVLNRRVPIIVIAHLRKTQGGKAADRLIPNVDDFHGTSNITKIATVNILLAADWDRKKSQPWLLPTYAQVVKNRLDGQAARFGASMDFNVKTNRYAPNYFLGEFKNNATEFQILTDVPKWANVNGLPSKL